MFGPAVVSEAHGCAGAQGRFFVSEDAGDGLRGKPLPPRMNDSPPEEGLAGAKDVSRVEGDFAVGLAGAGAAGAGMMLFAGRVYRLTG